MLVVILWPIIYRLQYSNSENNEQLIVVVVFLNIGFCQVIVLQPDIMLSYYDIITL